MATRKTTKEPEPEIFAPFRAQWAKKMVLARRNLEDSGGLVKSSKNSSQKYDYVSGDQFADKCGTAISEAGLCAFAKSYLNTNGDRVHYRLELLDTETGYAETATVDVPIVAARGMTAEKAVGSSITYAMKFCLRDALMLPRGEGGKDDPDGRDDRDYDPKKDVSKELESAHKCIKKFYHEYGDKIYSVAPKSLIISECDADVIEAASRLQNADKQQLTE